MQAAPGTVVIVEKSVSSQSHVQLLQCFRPRRHTLLLGSSSLTMFVACKPSGGPSRPRAGGGDGWAFGDYITKVTVSPLVTGWLL